jgi:adenylyltransferase/sulfurtransferase
LKEITVKDAQKLLGNTDKVLLIDTRDDREMALGYIKGARFIPISRLEGEIERLSVEKGSPVIVYCSSGNRSMLAVELLRGLGYHNALSLQGGFNAWVEAGYEIVSESSLKPEELRRYSRNVLLEEVGEKGQAQLGSARVLIVGAGGLGSPVGLYLAACGVGTLGIVDFDRVELSNLNRQILHGTTDVGKWKTESAKEAINSLNPHVSVIAFRERLTTENVFHIFEGFDIVVDAADNLQTKFLLNDACFFTGKPYVFGGAVRFEGQASVFFPKEGGPCLRCMFPKPPPQRLVPT